MSLRAVCVSFVLLLAGCATSKPAEAPSPLEQLKADAERVVATVFKQRGLSQRRPTGVLFHETQKFEALVSQQAQATGIPPTAADHKAVLVAFGFVGTNGKPPSSLAAVQREQILAFFDERDFVVHVHDNPAAASESELNPAWIVAHEVGHSLQHQHFTVPDLANMQDEDMRLASLAMLEGDAMLVMLAYAAGEEYIPLNRAIVDAARGIEEGAADEYRQLSGTTGELKSAPPVIRERLQFPYLAGTVFMGGVYRAGGYRLVNGVYDHPPVSTEQVIHPQKYLMGEQPWVVEAPLPPKGYEVVVSGRMGELQTRVALSLCNTRPAAIQAAEGWGGDAYSIVGADDTGALLWSTVWDTEDDAKQFEAAASRTAQCWVDKQGAIAKLFPGKPVLQRRGSRVALVRGLPTNMQSKALDELLDLPEKQPEARAPFGDVSIPPVRIPARTRAPFMANGAIISEHLGLRIPLPRGFRADLSEDIRIERDDPPGLTLVALSKMLVNPEANELLFRTFVESLQETLELDRPLKEVTTGRHKTAIGAAWERTWGIAETPIRARLLILPACDQTGAVLISQFWVDERTAEQMEWVLANMSLLGPGEPPVCAELNP